MFNFRLATNLTSRWSRHLPRRGHLNRLVHSSGGSESKGAPLFDKILIANRGEIACRVMKTCKKMGIKTVAIYSEADKDSLFVSMADEAVCVGPPASSDSYLRMDRILAAIEATGAQAVHPGYGFLSENSEFSKALKARGVAFIGPGEFAINAMGDKIHSKQIAQQAEVNVIPGYVGEIADEKELLRVANDIGYPVMIKASAGGGGKGMRVAYSDDEAVQGFRLSKREAASSFGDDTIFVEKFVEEPRHIEIQVLVDKHGNGIYLNERECSIQRRNQKVIEEAPSVFVTPEVREAMGKQALQLAKAVDYESAGTVEFLMDKHRNFYFLEMNTRLQVEHPITEMITNVDLVEQMIKVAAGKPLDYQQSDIGIHGWAIESRVYAEDPYREFLPSTGILTTYEEPKSSSSVRCDTGITEGSEISMFYDPMICKLVTHAETREEATEKMRHALDHYRIQGVRHNISFLRALCDHPAFIEGKLTTNFIPTYYPDGFKGSRMESSNWEDISAAAHSLHKANKVSKLSTAGFSNSTTAANALDSYVLNIKDGPVIKVTQTQPNSLNLTQLQRPHDEAELDQANSLELKNDVAVVSEYKKGEAIARVNVTAGSEQRHADIQVISADLPWYKMIYRGEEFEFEVMSEKTFELSKHMPVVEEIDTSRMVLSPMPGMLFSINVKEGQKVTAGDEVCVVEAMKMQNALQAPSSGVIASIKVEAGQSVVADQILIELED